MTVADNGIDSGQGGEFFRSALGIATGDDDPGIRISAADAADPGARLAIGFSGYAAGIDDNNSCGIGIGGGRESLVAQGGSDGFAVGAACPASEVFNVIFCHVA